MITPKEYLSLFRFRGDTFAIQHNDGSYRRVKTKKPTKQHIVDHLGHKKVLALYPAMNGVCYLGAIDLDIPHELSDSDDEWEELEANVRCLVDVIDSKGLLSATLTEKTGGRGYHIWLFSELIQVSMMRRLLTLILEEAGLEGEVFPQKSALGGAIRPPLGTHKIYKRGSVIVSHDTLEELDLTSDIVDSINANRISQDVISSLGIDAEETEGLNFTHVVYDDIPKLSSFEDVLDSIRPCFRKIYEEKTETRHREGWIFMTAAAVEILASGGTDEHVHQYFSPQEQYTRRTTAKHLKPIKEKNLTPFRCMKLIEDCSPYVEECCPDCIISKQKKIYSDLEDTVDECEIKDSRKDGTIRDTLSQFSFIASDITDMVTDNKYSLLVNGFNKGKSWAMISFIEHSINHSGGRVNLITHSKHVKSKLVDRMIESEIPFLDNPSSLDLCKRRKEFTKIGYVPTAVCKRCKYYSTIQSLIRPIIEDYFYPDSDSFYGTKKTYEEIAKNFSTCGKWVYLALLTGTNDESLVNISTSAKFYHHLFIEGSVYLNSLNSPILSCNIVDQLDFINRKIPKITFSEQEIIKKMQRLGISTKGELEERIEEISDKLEGDIDVQTLTDLADFDDIKQWIHIVEEFTNSKLRRVFNVNIPHIHAYDIASDKPLKLVLNDILGKRINPRLYDNFIKHLKNLRIEMTREDSVKMAPKQFRDIIGDITDNTPLLGITATPTDLELMNTGWMTRYQESQLMVLKNLYSISEESSLNDLNPSSRNIIFCKKIDGDDYINDKVTRGDSRQGGAKREIVIEGLQYPRDSEEMISDLVQLCGGNVGQGMKVFYQGIVGDALTQANKYDAEKIFVPNPKLFTSLGFKVHNNAT